MNNKVIYFPGLNGLRAIAAISVVISHITLSLNEYGLNPAIFGINKSGNPIGLQLGEYGVSIFFSLSGFLITYLLLQEKALSQINVKKFYVRRILRIWPLYYAYLLLAIVVLFSFGIKYQSSSLLFYFFYAANVPFIMGTAIPFLSHYWSLGVEEQYYLFWPWVIKKIDHHLLKLLLLITGGLIAAKLLLHILYPGSILSLILIVTRFQCMMIGSIAAVLYKRNDLLFLKIADNKYTQLISWVIIVLSMLNHFQIASIIDNEIISVVAAFLIIGQIRIKNRIVNLENKVFNFLGKISYGIYVIHPLVVFLFSKFMNFGLMDALTQYILVYFILLGGTIFLAYLSYQYFEKYFLKQKLKFTVIKSSASDPSLSTSGF